jgi:ABC-type Fe3+ transport system substrate-binding protein
MLAFRKWIGRLAAAAAATASVFGCATAPHTESLQTLYEKAKPEKAVVLYGGGPVRQYEPFAREFEQRFPGIKVSIEGGFSNVLDKKVDAQMQAGKLEVDLAIFQTLHDFLRWKKAGALLAFKPEGFDTIDPAFKDADGAFVAVAVNAHPYAYNPKFVRAEDVPRSALDFLKPQFRGRVVACYPADDDATMYVFYGLVSKYGWDYMDKYMANQPNFIQGHLGVVRSISSGANWVTLDSIAGTSLEQKKEGQPHELAFSDIDPLPVWPLTGAIFKDAPHPNAAKLFLTWYLAREQQMRIGNWSPRSDVPPPDGLKPLSSYRLQNTYRDFVSDEKLLAELRKRFETYTGPVRNTGGVR